MRRWNRGQAALLGSSRFDGQRGIRGVQQLDNQWHVEFQLTRTEHVIAEQTQVIFCIMVVTGCWLLGGAVHCVWIYLNKQ